LIQQWGGITFILLFLVFILQEIKDKGTFDISIAVALQICAAVNATSCFLSPFPSKWMG
jgi:hypothetical protein